MLYINSSKLLPFYQQLTKTRVGLHQDLQPAEQKNAHFVGSQTCIECHKENHTHWQNSRHPHMVQHIESNNSVVIADFSKLPNDASFTLKDAVYTVGGKL
ncbi:MAG: multiheme c-type cytochrome [Campylobacterota bacterium]|nr:multiheme c-type cytochrome [Campylobacterota bacterium]